MKAKHLGFALLAIIAICWIVGWRYVLAVVIAIPLAILQTVLHNAFGY